MVVARKLTPANKSRPIFGACSGRRHRPRYTDESKALDFYMLRSAFYFLRWRACGESSFGS